MDAERHRSIETTATDRSTRSIDRSIDAIDESAIHRSIDVLDRSIEDDGGMGRRGRGILTRLRHEE